MPQSLQPRAIPFAISLILAASSVEAATDERRPVTYMAFGDSITDGVGSSDETGYRLRLESDLKARFGDARVIDEGHPGADSRRGARTARAALSRHKPDVTLILFGSNDWKDDPRHPPRPADTVHRLRKIVREAKARGSQPFLATIPPTNTGFDSSVPAVRNAWVEVVNAGIRKLAREEHAALVDVHAALVSAAPLRALYADGVHPNDAGYAVIEQAFFEALAREGPAAQRSKR